MAPTETTRREDKMTANSIAAPAKLGDSRSAARTALAELNDADRLDAEAERLAGEQLMASARKLDHAGRRALQCCGVCAKRVARSQARREPHRPLTEEAASRVRRAQADIRREVERE